MVAVINASKSLRNALHYNENKVKQAAAKLIHSSSYPKDTDQLGFTDKLRVLQKRTELNERTLVNCVHISLNFDPSEKLNEDMLRQIAASYMQKIGFGGQPYLVYQHNDAAHPHIHLVTTNIRADGNRIKLHNIGKIQSELARKEIEKEFRLVQADSKRQKQSTELRPINAQKVIYGRSGKSGTKRAITNVLDVVLPAYKYASLSELNAVLKLYNVTADQGGKDSRIYKNNGLVYRVLNEKGEKVGVPIPASHIYNKPTIKFLQQQFVRNEAARQHHKPRVKNAIDLAILRKQGLTIQELSAALQKESIQLVLRQNKDGIIYGMTYVDHKTKCVFNGSDLGKPYSANQIQQRCRPSEVQQQNQVYVLALAFTPAETNRQKEKIPRSDLTTMGMGFPDLIQPDRQGNSLAAELREEQKKKRRKKLRH